MRVDIQLQVIMETPLHIGTGSLADSLADKPLIKDARGYPIIPGSAIKGKARHLAEQIARALASQWNWECEAPYPDRLCQGSEAAQVCPLCRIFGAPSYPSPMLFRNLSLNLTTGLPYIKGWSFKTETEVRSGVGLSRSLRTAQEDILYTTEAYLPPPALQFQGEIAGELEERGEAALLVAALRAIRTLGGNRSRGLGHCRLAPAVTIDGTEQDISQLLKELPTWLS